MIEVRRDPAASPTRARSLTAMERRCSTSTRCRRMPTPRERPRISTRRGGAYVAAARTGRRSRAAALKRLEPGVAEIKRMYVVPDARGRGLARRLLAAIEDAARELGYARVRLDTGASQPHARALYESAGYGDVPDYNDNPYAAYWGEKVLR